MRAPLFLTLAAVSLGLVGYAVVSLQTPPSPRSRAEAPKAEDRKEPATPAAEPPLVRFARSAAAPPTMAPEARQEAPEPAPEPTSSPEALPLDRAATEAAFDALLGRLEAISEPRKLSPDLRAELFRQTNDALAALSTQLGDDTEALEDAYARVQAEVRRLRLRPTQELDPGRK